MARRARRAWRGTQGGAHGVARPHGTGATAGTLLGCADSPPCLHLRRTCACTCAGPMRAHALMPRTLLSRQALETGQKLVVDLDFVDKMLDTELKSICKQLGYAWHANCAAAVPAHLVLTSMQVRCGAGLAVRRV